MEEFNTYKKIWALGKPDIAEIFTNPEDIIVMQGKMDGANMRTYIEKGVPTYGSRRCTLGKLEDHRYGKNFKRCVDFLSEKLKGNKLDGVILMGENMVKHTLSYNWDNMPPFLGFDVYSIKDERYLPYEEVKQIYDSLGIEMVPLIKICKAKDILIFSDAEVPVSKYAPTLAPHQQEEGVVFKNYKKTI